MIDIFAGPGGLGEGFASLRTSATSHERVFRSALSIEKDPAAHRTLKLRAFTRQFPDGRIPEDYYAYLRGELSLDHLYDNHPRQAHVAASEAWCHELSAQSNDRVRGRILQNLTDPRTPWVLLGGPPCQPFSLAGRSRNAPGTRTQFSDGKDTRHNLYREYLQIIADFWPAVFVMENVRGLLSARFDGEPMFPRIQSDLRDPASVVGNRRRRTDRAHSYRLYSVNPIPDKLYSNPLSDQYRPEDYLVRCENHGIPQARHRLILLGVRDDFTIRPASLKPRPLVPACRVLDDLPPLRGGLSKSDSPAAREAHLLKAFDSAWIKQVNRSDSSVRKAVEDALHNLQHPAADRGDDYLPTPTIPTHRPDWYHDVRLDGTCNHMARGHMPSDLHRYLFAAAFAQVHARSPKLEDFPPALLPAHQNAANPTKNTKFADRFRVQLPGRPATTIVSHIAKDGHYYIHPDPTQCRSLTVREAARLQTFPDNYCFVPAINILRSESCRRLSVARFWSHGRAA